MLTKLFGGGGGLVKKNQLNLSLAAFLYVLH